MALRIIFDLNQKSSPREQQICLDYWRRSPMCYEGIEHFERLCDKHGISKHEMSRIKELGYACLDDMRCEQCGACCPISIPGWVDLMRERDSWTCDHFTFQAKVEENLSKGVVI